MEASRISQAGFYFVLFRKKKQRIWASRRQINLIFFIILSYTLLLSFPPLFSSRSTPLIPIHPSRYTHTSEHPLKWGGWHQCLISIARVHDGVPFSSGYFDQKSDPKRPKIPPKHTKMRLWRRERATISDYGRGKRLCRERPIMSDYGSDSRATMSDYLATFDSTIFRKFRSKSIAKCRNFPSGYKGKIQN